MDHIDFHEQKPPLVTANSAPPVLQSGPVDIKEGFTFGTCPSEAFIGTPATELGPFEYPDMSNSASSSRRPSLAHPDLRRGSSSSSTITALSTATRRPSLAPTAMHTPPASFSEGIASRRRGSMFHFQTKPVTAPIPPSLLARRGSLPATEAIFGLPSFERRPHPRAASISSSNTPQSPPTRPQEADDRPHSPSTRKSPLRARLPLTNPAGSTFVPPPPSQPLFSYPSPTAPADEVYRNRQSTSTNSSRGSLLSHSSLCTEDVIRDEDESTDQETAAEVDTPGSSSETEAMGLFVDPWLAKGVAEVPADIPNHHVPS